MQITPKHSIGIIGGQGKTGNQFATLFRNQGFTVDTTGKDDANRNRELIDVCDIIIFAVPLYHSVEIMRVELEHATRSDQLILDVSSLKAQQVDTMSQAPGEVIGMHPLFGPSTDAHGQTIVLCPARCEEETQTSLQVILEAMGMKVLIQTPSEHDSLMALLQVIPHIKSFIVADTLKRLGADLEKIRATCTPAYSLELDLVGRFLDDTADLYGPIIFENPETTNVLDALQASLDSCREAGASREGTVFADRYHELQTYFGEQTTIGREKSERCIRTLAQGE